MPVPTTPPHVQIEVIPTLASAGNGLELKCGIDAANIIWKRHGAQLSDDKRSHQLMVTATVCVVFISVMKINLTWLLSAITLNYVYTNKLLLYCLFTVVVC